MAAHNTGRLNGSLALLYRLAHVACEISNTNVWEPSISPAKRPFRHSSVRASLPTLQPSTTSERTSTTFTAPYFMMRLRTMLTIVASCAVGAGVINCALPSIVDQLDDHALLSDSTIVTLRSLHWSTGCDVSQAAGLVSQSVRFPTTPSSYASHRTNVALECCYLSCHQDSGDLYQVSGLDRIRKHGTSAKAFLRVFGQN